MRAIIIMYNISSLGQRFTEALLLYVKKTYKLREYLYEESFFFPTFAFQIFVTKKSGNAR